MSLTDDLTKSSETTRSSETGNEVQGKLGKNELKSEPTEEGFLSISMTKTINILIHKTTGVQYVRFFRNAGYDGGIEITPLLKQDGTPFTGNESTVKPERFILNDLDGSHHILKDTETNVLYLIVYRNAGGDGGVDITPLLGADGSPYIAEKEKDSHDS
jgi:hypothetical protein